MISIFPSDPKCLECRYFQKSSPEHDLVIQLWHMPIESYRKGLKSHLMEAIERFEFSPGEKEGIKESVDHIALKLYAYSHYATIRDFLKLPVDIKYEHIEGYYRFNLVVHGLSHIPELNKTIGIECVTTQAFLNHPMIIDEKVKKAHYHLRMGDITRFELYLDPYYKKEQSLVNQANKIKLFGEAFTLRIPLYHYKDFVKAAYDILQKRKR